MTKKEAWTVLGGVFRRPNGLCGALSHLHSRGLISTPTYDAMDREIRRRQAQEEIQNGHEMSYIWPTNSIGDIERACFAMKKARYARR